MYTVYILQCALFFCLDFCLRGASVRLASKGGGKDMSSQPVRIFERTRRRLRYCWRMFFTNKPLRFHWVENEGEAVGKPISVYHLTLYDMMEHQARGIMTWFVLWQNLGVNAIQVLEFERLDDWNGRTMIQPRWVQNFGPVTE